MDLIVSYDGLLKKKGAKAFSTKLSVTVSPITYGKINGRSVISFCEFYKESTEAETPAELLKIKRDNTTVLDMLQSLTDNDIWIY